MNSCKKSHAHPIKPERLSILGASVDDIETHENPIEYSFTIDEYFASVIHP